MNVARHALDVDVNHVAQLKLLAAKLFGKELAAFGLDAKFAHDGANGGTVMQWDLKP